MEQRIAFIDILIVLIFLIWVLYFRVMNSLWLPNKSDRQVRLANYYFPLLTWLKYHRFAKLEFQAEKWKKIKPRLFDLVEWAIIITWALWVGRAYLNLDPNIWPVGSDFPRNIQLFFNWQWLFKCGTCVFWNGTINGGMPAFADFFTPVLYPPLVITNLIWGVFNGSKILLVISLILAGLAQWWLAKVLHIGRLARLWSALMVVAGGHLSSRMEMGHIVMVTSVAAGSLVLAPLLDTLLTGRRRSIIALSLMMTFALVSGHGYVQLALVLGVLPSALIFLFDGSLKIRKNIVIGLLLAAGFTVLISAVYWLPLATFWSQISKLGDSSYATAQPALYSMLNLIIADRGFYAAQILGRGTAPAMYMEYIGWVPILMLFFSLRLIPKRSIRVLAFALIAIILIYLASSAVLFKWLGSLKTGDFFSMGRNMSLLQPLAIPLILILAAWGVDELFKLHWPGLFVRLSSGATIGFNLSIILIVPLFWGLKSVYSVSQDWYMVEIYPNEKYLADITPPATAQWTRLDLDIAQFPFYPKAIDAGYKIVISPDYTVINWVNRSLPTAYLQLTRDINQAGTSGYQLTTQDGVLVIEHPENQYASVNTGARTVPCDATSLGGNIDVTCITSMAGVLTVQENWWSGWVARVDGKKVNLKTGPWLSVLVPSGMHKIEFRYHSWEVWTGLILTVLGLALAVLFWWRPFPCIPDKVLVVAEVLPPDPNSKKNDDPRQ